jgi:hypothetical protein
MSKQEKKLIKRNGRHSHHNAPSPQRIAERIAALLVVLNKQQTQARKTVVLGVCEAQQESECRCVAGVGRECVARGHAPSTSFFSSCTRQKAREHEHGPRTLKDEARTVHETRNEPFPRSFAPVSCAPRNRTPPLPAVANKGRDETERFAQHRDSSKEKRNGSAPNHSRLGLPWEDRAPATYRHPSSALASC